MTRKWRRPPKWKSIIGYVGLYEISNTHQVRHFSSELEIYPYKDSGNYNCVDLTRNGITTSYRILNLVNKHFKPINYNRNRSLSLTLTAEDMNYIYENPEKKTQRELALMFGIAQSTISKMCRRERRRRM